LHFLYNAADPTERYRRRQTIVAQANVFLTTGTRLMSDEGNVLMTTLPPTPAAATTPIAGRDCSCGINTLRYGHHTKHQHACVENFLLALGRHSMGKRDMVSKTSTGS